MFGKRRHDRELREAAEREARAERERLARAREEATPRAVFMRIIRQFSADQCTDLAATLTYYGVLSLFPALLAVFSLLGVVGQGGRLADQLLQLVGQFAPASTVKLIGGPVHQFASSSAAGFGLVIGIVLAIWSASGYVGAFSRAMNRIYGFTEGRRPWVLKPQQLLITLVLIVLVALMAILLVISGPVVGALGGMLGLGDAAQAVWSIGRWPVVAAAAVFAVALLYWGTPNVRFPKFRWLSPGALVAVLAVAVATAGFGFYVANFANYNKSYGSLGGVIIFLVWLWIANLMLLFGAEVDVELERGRELQAGLHAEDGVQLPPRGEKKNGDTDASTDASGGAIPVDYDDGHYHDPYAKVVSREGDDGHRHGAHDHDGSDGDAVGHDADHHDPGGDDKGGAEHGSVRRQPAGR